MHGVYWVLERQPIQSGLTHVKGSRGISLLTASRNPRFGPISDPSRSGQGEQRPSQSILAYGVSQEGVVHVPSGTPYWTAFRLGQVRISWAPQAPCIARGCQAFRIQASQTRNPGTTTNATGSTLPSSSPLAARWSIPLFRRYLRLKADCE